MIFFGASELKTLHFAFRGRELNLIVWHGTTKSRPKHDFIHRMVYSGVNFHVAISNHLVNNVRKIVPPTRGVSFRVVYPSFRITGEINTGPSEGRRIRLVHIGRIADGKGQNDAVEACAALHREGVDFQLDLVGSVGDDKYSRDLQVQIRSAPYAGRINLVGYVEDTLGQLAGADLFLFPSYGEGMPNAFIEALHFGVPCLAYANTVFPEFISMGFHVTLAADRDCSDLSDKLLKMVAAIDEEKRASYPNAQLAKKYFNVQRELADWREILT